MAKTYQHNCIKPACGTLYSDTDPEAYYCHLCQKKAKEIAEKIDKQLKGKASKRKIVTPLQEYENAPKVHGFMYLKA